MFTYRVPVDEMTNRYEVILLFKVKCKALIQNTPCNDQEHLYIFRLFSVDTRLPGLSHCLFFISFWLFRLFFSVGKNPLPPFSIQSNPSYSEITTTITISHSIFMLCDAF